MANRNLMPKSGAMAPYIVVNRDAAVAGVFSVDDMLGAVDLTTKYVQITAYNQKIGTIEQRISTNEADIVLINQTLGSLNTAVGNLNTSVSNKAGKGANSDITSLSGLTTALSVAQGGTGGKTAAEARTGLQLDRIYQWTDRTSIRPPNLKYNLIVADTGIWGVYEEGTNIYKPLGIGQGGTGATSALDARANLFVPGLTEENTFTQKQTIVSQEGLHLRKTTAAGNSWIAWQDTNQVVRYRIGMLGDTWSAYGYDTSGTSGRQFLNYDYSSNILSSPSIVNLTNQFQVPTIELGINNPNSASFVDFHYSGKYDWDARIICDGMNMDSLAGGNLRLVGGYVQIDGKGAGSNITGNRLRVNTTDAIFETQVGLSSGSIQVPGAASDTAPIGAGLRGIHAGVDSNAFDRASNINLYSWYGVAFCTAYTSPINGIVQGKPAVLINTRDGNINTLGVVISKGVTLTSDINRKDDIKEIDGERSSELLAKLGTYTYHYKGGTTYTAGVIAQEVEKVFPELVSVNEADDNALQVDYMGVLGHVHAAFKSEREKRIALEERLAKMEEFLASKFEDF